MNQLTACVLLLFPTSLQPAEASQLPPPISGWKTGKKLGDFSFFSCSRTHIEPRNLPPA
ncbi:hypothetical protein SLEP1_g44280 [Rubroshorea leprosula]|uniref:Uncharacterized protein n=1 Tax=Rubroshorea leprosula TaxID=152421 RepID=A0AAV5LFQ0_9ROSI|nr:hypothetical protein SLEP1_g44280 [Rubroshorea leprosula]